MSRSSIDGYALALLDIAKESKKIKEFKKEAKLISSVIEKNEIYIEILRSKDIEIKKRHALIIQAFEGQIDQLLLNFMLLLIDKNKVKELELILKQLISYINIELKIYEGIVFSRIKISKPQLKDIEITTSKKLKLKVILINKVDHSLLGGLRVVVGDIVIDNSVLNMLEKLRYELLEESRLN